LAVAAAAALSGSNPTSTPTTYPTSGTRTERSNTVDSHVGRIAHATGAFTQLISGLSEDPASAFRQIDEDFIKPHLLLDPGTGGGSGGSGSHGPGNV
jgi:sodium/hydrogen exchanger-like protein 6/7